MPRGKGTEVLQMKTSMRDVAEHAGVSIATVSHVLNKTRFVSPDTEQRVLDSIDTLDYYPDPTARSFKTGKRNLTGIIVPDISNRFWALIIEVVENILAENGTRLIIVNTKENEQRELDNVRLLAGGLVDGLIIASTLGSFDALKSAVPTDFPMVFIDRTLPDCICDTIVISNYNAMYQGVSGLIDAGHTRIGYIAGLMHLSTTAERLEAYHQAMADHQLIVSNEFVQMGDSMSNSAVQPLHTLLECGCTALVVSNNVMADDVLFYLAERNIKLGSDIEILGYNEDGRQDYNLRRMNLIVQPCRELGELAAQQILERIAGLDAPPRNTALHSTLLVRK